MSEAVEISLFPIPESVHFPLGVVSLHVFEPRYRQLIKESTGRKRLVGVTHIKSTISEGGKPTNLSEALSTNQSVYDPQDVFSAGFCVVKETMDDGRMMVEIALEDRYKIVKITQQLPYMVAECELYDDEDSRPGTIESIQRYRNRLDQFLLANAGSGDHSFADVIKGDTWKNLSHLDYSFRLFSVVGFDPEIQQEILELRSPDKRLEFACRVLNLI